MNLQLPGRRKGIVRVFGMAMCTLLYLKWITNKDLLNRTGNSVQCCVASQMGGELWRMDTCVCMAESFCCPLEIITALLIFYTPV